MIGLGFAALIALGWTAVAAKIVLAARAIRFLAPSDTNPTPDLPAIDVIVPAHNEQADIEATVRCLAAQDYPNLRITIVDDRSTDATGAILDRLAETLPIRVIHGETRPSGWVGKTWAIDQGLTRAEAEWVLFVDADMGLDPRAVRSAMEQAGRSGADLVSVVARPIITTFWQGAIALAVGEILFSLYPLHRVNDPESPQALAAGGFILVRKSLYDRVGGHRALRAEIVEDIQLARAIKAAGGRLSVHLAPDLVTTHMYGSFGQLWRGLRKNAYAGMEYYFHKFAVGAVVGLVMAWGPIAATIFGLATRSRVWVGVGAWGWAAQVASVSPSIVFLRIAPWCVLSFPLGVSAYVAIATSSVWNHHRGRILWKDQMFPSREVQAGSRRSPP